MYESTFDARWFTRAVELADTILERFLDPTLGGFFSVSDDHTGLIARRKDLEDAPIPAGGSAAAFGLLRLARMTGEARYEEAALSLIRLLHVVAPQHPLAFGHLLRAIDFQLAPVREVALAGDDDGALARVVRGGFWPYVVLAGGDGQTSRSWRAVPRSTERRPPTSASASPASSRCLARKIWQSRCKTELFRHSHPRDDARVSCFDAGNRNPNNAAAELAARQWGVLDIDELRACGLSAGAVLRRRRSGILHAIYPGVYGWGHDGLTIRGRCLAAVKACGTGAALSNRAAVSLWGLLDWEEDQIPHVTVPTSYGRKIPGIVVHRTRVPFKIVRFDSIPVTTPARALIDSSSALPFDLLRRAVREALALRRVTINELITTPGQRHRNLHEIIAEGYVPTRNEFEDAFLDLIDEGGFARPDVNKWITVDGKPTQPDFRWPEQRLVIEADGGQWHDHPLARKDDAERQARLEAAGERVIRVSWKQAMFSAKQTIARLRAAGAPSNSTGAAVTREYVQLRLTEDPWPDSFPFPPDTPPNG